MKVQKPKAGKPVLHFSIRIQRVVHIGYSSESMQFVREDMVENTGRVQRFNLMLGDADTSYDLVVASCNYHGKHENKGLQIRVIAPSIEDIKQQKGNPVQNQNSIDSISGGSHEPNSPKAKPVVSAKIEKKPNDKAAKKTTQSQPDAGGLQVKHSQDASSETKGDVIALDDDIQVAKAKGKSESGSSSGSSSSGSSSSGTDSEDDDKKDEKAGFGKPKKSKDGETFMCHDSSEDEGALAPAQKMDKKDPLDDL